MEWFLIFTLNIRMKQFLKIVKIFFIVAAIWVGGYLVFLLWMTALFISAIPQDNFDINEYMEENIVELNQFAEFINDNISSFSYGTGTNGLSIEQEFKKYKKELLIESFRSLDSWSFEITPQWRKRTRLQYLNNQPKPDPYLDKHYRYTHLTWNRYEEYYLSPGPF